MGPERSAPGRGSESARRSYRSRRRLGHGPALPSPDRRKSPPRGPRRPGSPELSEGGAASFPAALLGGRPAARSACNAPPPSAPGRSTLHPGSRRRGRARRPVRLPGGSAVAQRPLQSERRMAAGAAPPTIAPPITAPPTPSGHAHRPGLARAGCLLDPRSWITGPRSTESCLRSVTRLAGQASLRSALPRMITATEAFTPYVDGRGSESGPGALASCFGHLWLTRAIAFQ